MSLSVLARKTRAKQNAKFKNSKCGFFSRGSIKKQGLCNNSGCCVKSHGGTTIDKCEINCNMGKNMSYGNYLRRKVRGSTGSGKCCIRGECEKVNLGCGQQDKITGECLMGCANVLNSKSTNILKSSDNTDIKKKRAIYCDISGHNNPGYYKCVSGACLPSNVRENIYVMDKCVGTCNSKPRISYTRIEENRCTYTKKVNVAGSANVGMYNAINRRTDCKKI